MGCRIWSYSKNAEIMGQQCYDEFGRVKKSTFDFRQIYNMNKNNNQKFFNGLNKFRLRNSLPDNIINEIKFRESKQPLKWDFKEELIKKKKIYFR